MSEKTLHAILLLAIATLLSAGAFWVYILMFGGREAVTVCNRSGAVQEFTLEFRSTSLTLPLLDGTLADGACLDAKEHAAVGMNFRISVGGVAQDFGTITKHTFTVAHRFTLLPDGKIDYTGPE